MPMQPFFGEDTPKVVEFFKRLSEYHYANKTQLSLKTVAQRVLSAFPKTPRHSKKTRDGKVRKPGTEFDPLRHILYKLAKKHKIWFGQTF